MKLWCLIPILSLACGATENPRAASAVEPTSGTAQAEPRAVRHGDIYTMEIPDSDEWPSMLMVAIASQQPPAGAAIGRIQVHDGHWTVRLVAEVPAEYDTVSRIGREGVCEVRVVRARHLHVRPSTDGSPDLTFLALDLEGCDAGQMGVAGAPVEVHPLERGQLTEPATLELVALVRSYDDGLGWEDPVPASDYRMIRLRGLEVVVGAGAWVVRDGEVLRERGGGIPALLVDAESATFFYMTSPSQDWSSSIDSFDPLP